MKFLQYTKRKWFFIVVILMVCFLILKLIQYSIFKPIQYAIREKEIVQSEPYIVCEYVEVTGFFWRVASSNINGLEGEYVELDGIDPLDICSDNILYGGNRFVFYGDHIENKFSGIIGENYIAFSCTDWEILKPVKRLYLSPVPSSYLYDEDFRN